MEETQTQSRPRTKIKSEPVLSEQYESLKEMGIPVHTAVFHRAVTGLDGALAMPEHAFYNSGTDKPSRVAKMWYTPHGLLCEQKRGAMKTIVPLANIVYVKLL